MEKMTAGMISVIIPVYNTEKYISRCVESVINQTYQNFEVILVDDGSTDESARICDEWVEMDTRITSIHQKNQGVSAARNNGLDVSKGEFISFIDSDDWLETEMFQRMIDAIIQFDAEIAACDFYEYKDSENGKAECLKKNVWGKYQQNTLLEGKVLICELCKTMTLWNKILKRSLIAEKRFDPALSYGEDAFFFMEQIVSAKKAVVVPYYGYYYFVNRSGNVVSAPLCKKDKDCLETGKKIYDIAKGTGVPEAGVLRIYYAVGNILRKMKLTKSPNDREFIDLCKKIMRTPSVLEVYRFFKYYGVAKRFLIMRVNLAWLLKR